MENTKEILEWKKEREKEAVLKLAEIITANGMDEDSIFRCYMIRDVLNDLTAVHGFFNAWHPEGEQTKRWAMINEQEND